jgi:L-alanine-DL-glutamate epimerase-like enolase superfamily enzyme
VATAIRTPEVTIDGLDVAAYTIPTDTEEQDGTLTWDSTTINVVEAHAGDVTGLGYSYGHQAIASLIASKLSDVVQGVDATDPQAAWAAMSRALRNNGETGISYMAIAAVDIALWDLKARLLGLPLARLLGRWHEQVPVYGSGGFTSYDDEQLLEQLCGWVGEGIPRVKMKVGRDNGRDLVRARRVRDAIGSDVELFVDANGAYSRKEALEVADAFWDTARVSWLEEPVTSDDPEGLRFVRDRAPAGMEVAAGEYGYALVYFRDMIEAGCVDVVQADVTRCGGITNLLRVDALCKARSLPLSGHCAPAVSAHALAGCECTVHLEYFHDHVRIEQMLFDGTLSPAGGELRPDDSRAGLGLELRRADAERFKVR